MKDANRMNLLPGCRTAKAIVAYSLSAVDKKGIEAPALIAMQYLTGAELRSVSEAGDQDGDRARAAAINIQTGLLPNAPALAAKEKSGLK